MSVSSQNKKVQVIAEIGYLVPNPMMYRNATDENCVGYISEFFKDLQSTETVSARILNSKCTSLPYERVVEIFNHLDSSVSWKKVSDWEVEVEYTISHPEGDVVAVDTNTTRSATLTRRTVTKSCSGSCIDSSFEISRVRYTHIDQLDFNTSLYSSVRILKSKRFHYQTERSSWTFRVSLVWEGETKACAEKSNKKYLVFVETNDVKVATTNPRYTAASFLEKVIDVMSVSGKRRDLKVESR